MSANTIASLKRNESRNTKTGFSGRVHVCHVSMYLKTGGLERLLVEFARRHDADRYRLSFVALQDLGRPAEEIRNLGCDVHTIDLAKTGKPKSLLALRKLFAEEQVEIVHTHNTYAHFYGAISGNSAGCPVIVNTQHGRGCGDSWKARTQFILANRLTDCIAGVSRDAAALCRGQDRLSANKTIALWNGIDLGRFSFHGPVSSPTLIAVARLSPEKDFPTLLRAVAMARCQVEGLKLMIVGDGAERPMLEQLARDLHLDGSVEFLGERRDVPDLLRRAGLFVSSSKTEGISLTLLEAMAVGLPVLATRVGGNAEVVDDGVTGRLVPAESPQCLSAAIVRLCGERDLWSGMGQLGRQRVETNFDVNRMVSDYEGLYRELLVSKRAGV